MAYNGLTNAGAAYLAARQANNLPVEFLKAKVGNGIVPSGTNPAELTDIISEKMEIEISDIQQVERTLKMTVQVSNESLTTGFQLTEIAIFVNDNGTPVLYWYIGKDNGTYVPDSTKPMKYKNILNIEVSSTPISTVNYTGKELWVDEARLAEVVEKKLDTSIFTGSESTGNIQDPGTKTKGSIYWDNSVTPKVPYLCVNTTTDITPTSNFIAADNKSLGALGYFETYNIIVGSNNQHELTFRKIGRIVSVGCVTKGGSISGVFSGNILPENFRPSVNSYITYPCVSGTPYIGISPDGTITSADNGATMHTLQSSTSYFMSQIYITGNNL